MGVSKDKKVTFEAIYAAYTPDMTFDEDDAELDDEGSESEFKSDISKERYEYLAKKGYTVEPYKEKTENFDLAGVKITKTFDDIDAISANKEVTLDVFGLLDSRKGETIDDKYFFSKDGDIYKAHYLFDLTEDGEEEESMDISLEQYKQYFDLKYVVTLPENSKSNNATTVSDDGKTLTWELEYGKENDVKFEFSLDGTSNSKKDNNNITIYIIAGAAAGFIVAIVLLLVSKMKNNGSNGQVQSVQPVTPVQPVEPVQPAEQPAVSQETSTNTSEENNNNQ